MRKYTAIILFIVSSKLLFSTTASIDIPGKTPAQSKKLVIKTLNKIGAGYNEVEETNGFAFRFKDSFFTPYNFDLAIGRYNKSNSLVRIDSRDRVGFAIGDAILQENGHKPFANKYSTKSVLLADFLTLISPSAGILYTNLGTPLSRRSTAYMNALIYFGVDLLAFWLGSKTFFTHGIDPLGRGKIATAILMGGHRVFHLFPITMRVMTHNNLVSLGYTFRF